jgi:HCOMODA/2-hydroxy-3-carboxy-muconic semialdehyde decarboxylase
MGHVSVRHDRNPNRFLMSRAVPPEFVTVDDVMEFDLDSNPIDARDRGLNRERFIHGEIYKARADVKAIVHNHSPSLIPFGITGVPLRPVYHMAPFVAEGVPVFDIRGAVGMSNMLVENPAAARALARALGAKPAALMRGHGAAVVGRSLPTVVGRSVYLEMNAKLQAQAMTLGGKVTYLDPEEARQAAVIVETYARAWELWKRKATISGK